MGLTHGDVWLRAHRNEIQSTVADTMPPVIINLQNPWPRHLLDVMPCSLRCIIMSMPHFRRTPGTWSLLLVVTSETLYYCVTQVAASCIMTWQGLDLLRWSWSINRFTLLPNPVLAHVVTSKLQIWWKKQRNHGSGERGLGKCMHCRMIFQRRNNYLKHAFGLSRTLTSQSYSSQLLLIIISKISW